MTTLNELARQAMTLAESDRAALASVLLSSLAPVLSDDDDGIAEALRREKELDDDPAATVTLAQLNKQS